MRCPSCNKHGKPQADAVLIVRISTTNTGKPIKKSVPFLPRRAIYAAIKDLSSADVDIFCRHCGETLQREEQRTQRR